MLTAIEVELVQKTATGTRWKTTIILEDQTITLHQALPPESDDEDALESAIWDLKCFRRKSEAVECLRTDLLRHLVKMNSSPEFDQLFQELVEHVAERHRLYQFVQRFPTAVAKMTQLYEKDRYTKDGNRFVFGGRRADR